MAIRAVVYDIGNVLIEWQPEAYYDRVLGRARRMALFEAVDLHAMNHRIDSGEDFRETVYATARAHPDWADPIRLWHDDWLGLAQPVIGRSVALLRRLVGKGVPVFILSNIGDAVFELAAAHHDFLSLAERHYISGRLKATKPEPAIYAAAEADSGLSPASLLFVDDRRENVAAAASRGWKGHVFDGPDGWADRLVAEELLTEAEVA